MALPLLQPASWLRGPGCIFALFLNMRFLVQAKLTFCDSWISGVDQNIRRSKQHWQRCINTKGSQATTGGLDQKGQCLSQNGYGAQGPRRDHNGPKHTSVEAALATVHIGVTRFQIVLLPDTPKTNMFGARRTQNPNVWFKPAQKTDATKCCQKNGLTSWKARLTSLKTEENQKVPNITFPCINHSVLWDKTRGRLSSRPDIFIWMNK